VGRYKPHLTESCDPDGASPHLITQVATTAAPVDDAGLTLPIEHDLAEVGRAPVEHLVDAGYMGAELIVEAAHLGIDLVGPVPIAGGRQEREHRARVPSRTAAPCGILENEVGVNS
jgi:hypothetical protein